MSDHIRLSTGREFYANVERLGLSWQGELELTHGFDGYVDEDILGFGSPEFAPEGRTTFTHGERREIAEHMIARWKEWGEKL